MVNYYTAEFKFFFFTTHCKNILYKNAHDWKVTDLGRLNSFSSTIKRTKRKFSFIHFVEFLVEFSVNKTIAVTLSSEKGKISKCHLAKHSMTNTCFRDAFQVRWIKKN